MPVLPWSHPITEEDIENGIVAKRWSESFPAIEIKEQETKEPVTLADRLAAYRSKLMARDPSRAMDEAELLNLLRDLIKRIEGGD